MNDLKFAFRQLRKNPGFTAAAALTLALGIGANTAIFSVLNGVLLKPLPYPNSQRLVWLSERSPSFTVLSISYPNFLDWRSQQGVFEHIGVYNFGGYNLTGRGEPERLEAVHMSAEAFSALGVQAALGRVFRDDEDKPGAPPVALISYGLWQRRFGGKPGILNRSILLDDHPYTVVGIMPRNFAFPQRTDVWTPVGQLAADPDWKDRGNHPGLLGVARLKPGVSLDQARVAMDTIAARLEKQYPDSNKNCRIRIDSLLEHYVGDVRPALWTLFGAVGLVLMIACANAASLMLARSLARQREMAMRSALGASRLRIVRQLLTESVMLALAGEGLGLLLGFGGLRLILALSANSLPRLQEISLDARVLMCTTAVALLTGIIFGLAPAWQLSRPAALETLKETARTVAGSRARLRQGLVVTEVALTLLLLIGAGLLLRSFYLLEQVNPGFAYERVSSFHVDLPARKYAAEERQISFYQELLEALRTLPGVEAASIASEIPLEGNNWQTGFVIAGQPAPSPGHGPMMEAAVVGPDYFRTMGIPVLRGRPFNENDNRAHLQGKDLGSASQGERWRAGLSVMVVDEMFAQRIWPNQDPVGKRVRLFGAGDQNPVVTIIGVVGRVKQTGLDEKGGFVQAYLPFLQAPFRDMTVVAKTTLAPGTFLSEARRATLRINPDQPIHDFRTSSEVFDESIAPRRLNLALVGLFASVALGLAVVGLYGVLAYAVRQRRREIGVRMALGAKRSDILKLILGQGMTLAFVGVGCGLAGAAALTRLMASLLYDVKPLDPLTFAAVPLLLAGVAVVACYLPARRAAKVDPMEALRYE